ncbi:Variant surface glycoprotein [Trypanosoma congolense IL3000]|uniref:Variant surface glycoprotein n=1 Tax=Trypanosoma congolense (strain IL3000) TaxID=1068625 RepID=F9WHB2_TRYCI|nr:Variant surface glycoprotein [Trypanosoma congolense IL3000]
MMMKIWIMVMVTMGVAGATNHNGPQYTALCDLLAKAVFMLEKKRGNLSEPLEKALERTIFGKDSGATVEDLRKNKLPSGYSGTERGYLCGNPFDPATHKQWPLYYPGYSGLHDMLCLCTPGENGWPLNKQVAGADKLCGQDIKTWGEDGYMGWASGGYEDGENQLTATWTNITLPCLKGGDGAGDLKSALQKFKKKLGEPVQKDPPYEPLGEGNFSDNFPCTGYSDRGVCVAYYNNTDPKPWWIQLEVAIQEDEKKKLDEEKRKLQTQSSVKATDLTSPTNTTWSRRNTTNITNRKSGSAIPQQLWLLDAVFFI